MAPSDDSISPQLWFHRVATHYVEAQALYHLNRAGVFQLLDREGPCDAATIAARLGLQLPVVETLMDYVAGVDDLVTVEAGRYAFTDFGRAVLARFGREGTDGGRSFNLFDVRTGAYGPVWSALGGLLSGDATYGEDIQRAGAEADEAVYKVGARLGPPLVDLVGGLGVAQAVEIGVHSGLLEQLASGHPALQLTGIDRSPASLERAGSRAHAHGLTGVRWLAADFHDTAAWLPGVEDAGPGVLFSIHGHELVATGTSALEQTLNAVSERLRGWTVVLLEQPLLAPETRSATPESLWLYNCSNVLIHHLIGNGRILPESDWLALLERSGGQGVRAQPVGYLGYHAFMARF